MSFFSEVSVRNKSVNGTMKVLSLKALVEGPKFVAVSRQLTSFPKRVMQSNQTKPIDTILEYAIHPPPRANHKKSGLLYLGNETSYKRSAGVKLTGNKF